jgi:hypothetical protein
MLPNQRDRLNATRSRIVALIVRMCTLIGLAVFGFLAWQAVTVEDGTRADAERRIASIRADIPSKAPLVEIDDDGRPVRMTAPGEGTGRPIARLRALAWRGDLPRGGSCP